MDKESVRILVEAALEENPSLFLIDLQLLPNSKILVEVDGDAGIALNECIRISRAVEGNLDREEEDFSLEVSSPDITKPLQVLRQYQKNIGRTLQVKTLETALEGTLVAVLEESIELEWKAREPKPIGKGKRTVEKKERIAFDAIVEAKVKLIF
ncbi:MAG: ribosome assembly cofactor RimP [Flavicella sp.]|jgi:ribosome maturation factor RimP|nr:ribosome assembly cofactor RimP [Flavicella sp.]